ncbi:MAG: hypothetical protein M1825_003184 [Sarcosagium campestre]|nr:MAG: hypothetical protein M1825_003184 [Sarcosagium campestre]
MEEKVSKGISLRKKRKDRPAISAPQPQAAIPSRPTQEPTLRPKRTQDVESHQPQPRSQQRAQAGGKTSDLVKRRYSTRFTNVPQDFDAAAPPMPSMPSIPKQYGAGLSAGQQPSSRGVSPSGNRQGIPVDLSALRDPNLRIENYVAGILADASEQDIREFQRNLQKARTRTSADLQQNVYQNRTQFIKISREAEQLKGEMRALRNLMAELKTNTNALDQASSGLSAPKSESAYEASSSLSRNNSNRSSVANLEAMWNTQLHALWKNVEGSQKFLPAAPGRHVLRDSPHWVELNAATWKGRRAMHMFLLNDHLLVASRKKKRVEQPTDGSKPQPIPSKLVAERCWPLQDIQMVDLASSGPNQANGARHEPENVGNAITIRVGKESFTYRNDKPDSSEKTGLLLSFRKAADELRKHLRAATDDTAKAADTAAYLTARDPALIPRSDLVRTLSGAHRPDILIDVDGKQQNLRWVEAQIDELDMAIALQRFEQAVAGVERLRGLAASLRESGAAPLAHDLLTVKADQRAARLAGLIMRRLVDTPAFISATTRNVGWLTRLGYEDRARDAFLQARSATVAKRVRQCCFTGSLPAHIHELAFVTFTLIKNTVSIYQACFPPLHMSAVVKWAASHVGTFNERLAKQLSSVPKGAGGADNDDVGDGSTQSAKAHSGGGGGGGGLWDECIDIAREHAKLLVEVGLDFKELIGDVSGAGLGLSGPAAREGTVGLGLKA